MAMSVFAVASWDPGPIDPAANFVSHFHLPSKPFMNASSSLEGRFGGGATGGVATGFAGDVPGGVATGFAGDIPGGVAADFAGEVEDCGRVVAGAAFFSGAVCSKGSADPVAFAAAAGLGDVEGCGGLGAAKVVDTLATMARLRRKNGKAPVLIIGLLSLDRRRR
jgi:hypothetical protein